MSKIYNGGLDQYGAGPFERQQFGTAGVERVKYSPTLTTAMRLDVRVDPVWWIRSVDDGDYDEDAANKRRR